MRKVLLFVTILCVMLNCFTGFSFAIDKSDLDEKTIRNITHSIEEQFPLLLDTGCQLPIDNLQIGKPIHLYDVTTRGIASSRELYPLFSGNKLAASVIQIDESHYQVSVELCETLAMFLNKPVALLYDSVHCYAYDGAKETVLCKYKESVDVRTELVPDMLKSYDLELTEIAPCYELCLNEDRLLYAMQTYYGKCDRCSAGI